MKSDELGDPIISDEHIIVFEWATHEELESIISISQRVNDFLTGYFYSQKIRLVDFKLEYGRFWDDQDITIMLADEISPDNCRLWDLQTNEKLDKDRFRQDLGNVDRAYKEVAYRLGVLSEKEFKKVLKMKFRVYVNFKEGILDPEAEAIKQTIINMGSKSIKNLVKGKFFDIEVENNTDHLKEIEMISRELLTNPVIENFKIIKK